MQANRWRRAPPNAKAPPPPPPDQSPIPSQALPASIAGALGAPLLESSADYTRGFTTVGSRDSGPSGQPPIRSQALPASSTDYPAGLATVGSSGVSAVGAGPLAILDVKLMRGDPGLPEQAPMPRQALPATVVAAVGLLLREYKQATVSWHTVVNNTTSQRPTCWGGSLFPALTRLTTFRQLDRQWHCRIDLPCMFDTDDGGAFSAFGSGGNKTEAKEDAMLEVMMTLCATSPERVRLVQSHWRRPIRDIVQSARATMSA